MASGLLGKQGEAELNSWEKRVVSTMGRSLFLASQVIDRETFQRGDCVVKEEERNSVVIALARVMFPYVLGSIKHPYTDDGIVQDSY